MENTKLITELKKMILKKALNETGLGIGNRITSNPFYKIGEFLTKNAIELDRKFHSIEHKGANPYGEFSQTPDIGKFAVYEYFKHSQA